MKDEALFVPSSVWLPDEYRMKFSGAGLTTAATPGLHQWFVRVLPYINALACAAAKKMAWRQDWDWVVAEVKRAAETPGVRESVESAMALGGREAAYDAALTFVPEYSPRMSLSLAIEPDGGYLWEGVRGTLR